MLAGTEEECRSRIRAWSGCADVLNIRHTYFDPSITPDDFFAAYDAMFRLAREL